MSDLEQLWQLQQDSTRQREQMTQAQREHYWAPRAGGFVGEHTKFVVIDPSVLGVLLEIAQAAAKFTDDGDSCITYPPCGDCRYCALDAALSRLDPEDRT